MVVPTLRSEGSPALTPAWKRGFSLTAEQLEASRAERMRQNGHGTLTLEDARTWIEETGLCLFLPRRQFSSSIAPSFVEAVAGERNATPDPRHIAVAEELLVRLETDGVAVRLNLLGLQGEQPDFVVAGWVLPYVYALRGDRDWRRNPQLTGSRQVSQLAVQAYKLLEAGDTTLSKLTRALGREGIVVTNPFIHLGHRRVVPGHQLLQFLLRRVVGIGKVDREPGLLLDQIADGLRRVRGQHRAH